MASSFHPGRFPVGSPASRAAARRLIDERRSSARLVELVLVKQDGEPAFGPWQDNGNGSFTRRSFIPKGVSFEEAERSAGLAPVQPKGEYIRLFIDV